MATELKQLSVKGFQPNASDDVLDDQHVLQAIVNIGPVWSQSFYRGIADSRNESARMAAAENLAAAAKEERMESVRVLKSMLNDRQHRIVFSAAVSLILLDDATGQAVLLKNLDSKNEWEIREAMIQLERLTQREQLRFATARLKSIAADKSTDETNRELAQSLLVK